MALGKAFSVSLIGLQGTLIEVEGTEEEIERFEKKQQKQKASLEKEQAESRKKTILYGKDLEEIRKIVREEIARAALTKTTYEYRYYYPGYNPNPYWVNPNPYYQPIWMGVSTNQNTVSSGQISAGQLNTDSNNWTLSTANVSSGPVTFTAATGSASNTVSVYASKTSAVKGLLDAGSVSGQWSSVVGSNSGIGQSSSNFLMSPRS